MRQREAGAAPVCRYASSPLPVRASLHGTGRVRNIGKLLGLQGSLGLHSQHPLTFLTPLGNPERYRAAEPRAGQGSNGPDDRNQTRRIL